MTVEELKAELNKMGIKTRLRSVNNLKELLQNTFKKAETTAIA